MNRQNTYYFLLFAIFLCIGGYLLFTVPKGGVLRLFNEQYTPLWNHFFFYITLLGTGIPTLLIVIGLLFHRMGDAVLLFVSTALAGLTTQLCKRFLFDDVMRPKAFLENIFADLNKVEGIYINAFHSFPSGHTTLAFATFCSLSLLVANKWWGAVFFLLALATGLSRIYLLQHFFIDVYGGAIVGTFVPLMVFAILPSTRFWQNNSWPGRALKRNRIRHE